MSLFGRSSAVMSTSMLPVKAGVWDLVRIGADKRTACCPSPVSSKVSYWLTGKTGPTARVRGGGGGEGGILTSVTDTSN